MRFQIVSPPLDKQIQETLSDQFRLSLNVVSVVFEKRAKIFQDEEFLRAVSNRAAGLLSPKSLPGALILLSILLKIIHFVLISKLASNAVRTVHIKQNKAD